MKDRLCAPFVATALLIAAGANFAPSGASAQVPFFHADGNKSGWPVATAGERCGQLLQAPGHLARANF